MQKLSTLGRDPISADVDTFKINFPSLVGVDEGTYKLKVKLKEYGSYLSKD